MKYFKWHESILVDIRVGSKKPESEGWDEVPNDRKGNIGDKREWFDENFNRLADVILIERGIRKDNRGAVYNINDKSTRIINELDEDLKDDETKVSPIENEPYQKFDKQKKKWVIDTDKKEQSAKEKIIYEKKQRKSAIESRLDIIDIRRLRPKEAITDGTATDEDQLNLKRLDDEKAALKLEYEIVNKDLKSA